MSTLYYHFEGLVPEQCIPTQNTFTVSATKDIGVVLTQWSYCGQYQNPAYLAYELVPVSGGQSNGPITVNGLYTSQSTTITFYNVVPGTYKLNICNTGACLSYGNGWIYY